VIRAVVRIVAVLVLVAIIAAAWLYLPRDQPARAEEVPAVPADPASAAEALAQVRALMDGEVEEVALGSDEIGALLTGPLAEYIPPGVGSPNATVDGGVLILLLPVPVASALPLPDVVTRALPDSVTATIRALVTSADDSFTIHIEGLALAGVPIPGFIGSSIAERLGIGDEAARAEGPDPENPLTWPLPRGVTAVYIDGDRLVLRGGR